MDMYEKALQKIKEGARDKPNFCYCPIVGPTGATERLFKSSNSIIIDSS